MSWTAFLQVSDCATGSLLAEVKAQLLNPPNTRGYTDTYGRVSLDSIDTALDSVSVSLSLQDYQDNAPTVRQPEPNPGGPSPSAVELCLFKMPHPNDPKPTYQPEPPRIAKLVAETAKSRRPGSIFVSWETPDTYDKWHLMWRDKAKPNESQYWSTAELDTDRVGSFAYRVSGTHHGTTYSFWVQGCVGYTVTKDRCSPFSPTVDIVMRNTNSLSEWLGDAKLKPGISSLGRSTYGGGVRAMMGLDGSS